ncbi:MAG: hypothetical protein ACR2GY_09795 [Phycisphaerales bacterium]
MKTLHSAITTGAVAALLGTSVSAAIIAPGTYRLGNHPDGGIDPPPYGLRLDELFNVSSGTDKFTFDFEATGAGVFLDYDGSTIRIYGRAFGGRDIGTTYDSNWTSFVNFDFTYRDNVGQVPGDDDLWVDDDDRDNNGYIVWEANNTRFDLNDKSDGTKSFRLGDEDNDQGHRGFAGISGWGWLLVNGRDKAGAQDWLFTLNPIPLPSAGLMGVAGLAVVGARRRRRA